MDRVADVLSHRVQTVRDKPFHEREDKIACFPSVLSLERKIAEAKELSRGSKTIGRVASTYGAPFVSNE